MKPSSRCLSLSAALLWMAAAGPALAADGAAATSPTSPAAGTTFLEPAGTLPNRFLLLSGMFTLGAAYVPALVVAIASDRAEDQRLYAPVVGPWMDLAARDGCTGACSGERMNEMLLVTNGVFQALGALQLLGAFLLPETQTVALRHPDGAPALAVSVMPASLEPGVNGVLALGQF